MSWSISPGTRVEYRYRNTGGGGGDVVGIGVVVRVTTRRAVVATWIWGWHRRHLSHKCLRPASAVACARLDGWLAGDPIPELAAAPAMTRDQRIAAANELLGVIASCGRNFFSLGDRTAQFEWDRGLWFRLESGARFRITNRSRWRGFHHGGTLRGLVSLLAEWIRTGHMERRLNLGPWPDWVCGNGDLWGYGADMQQVRDAADRVGIPRVGARADVPS